MSLREYSLNAVCGCPNCKLQTKKIVAIRKLELITENAKKDEVAAVFSYGGIVSVRGRDDV
jgi:hypothetical protein